MMDIGLVKQLLPEENYSDEDDGHGHSSFLSDHEEELLLDLGFDAGMHGNQASLASFLREAEEVLNGDL